MSRISNRTFFVLLSVAFVVSLTSSILSAGHFFESAEITGAVVAEEPADLPELQETSGDGSVGAQEEENLEEIVSGLS